MILPYDFEPEYTRPGGTFATETRIKPPGHGPGRNADDRQQKTDWWAQYVFPAPLFKKKREINLSKKG